MIYMRVFLILCLIMAFGGAPAEAQDEVPLKAHNIVVVSDKVPDMSSLEAWKKAYIKPGMTDEQKALAVFESIFTFRHQWSPPNEWLHDNVHDPIKQFNVYGYAMCCCSSSNCEALARYIGLEARGWGINAHSVPEIYYDNAWHLLDSSLITYFRNRDGAIASVDEIIAACKAWFEKHPEYKGNDKKLRELSRSRKQDAPQMLAESEFYDARGWLPAATHGLYSTMQEYDGSRGFVYEYPYTTGYRAWTTLRAGEALTRNWFNKGKHINMNGNGGDAPLKSVPGKNDFRYTPKYGDLAPGRVGCGEHVYTPVLNADFLKTCEENSNLKISKGLQVIDADTPGIAVIKMEVPYVVLTGAVKGRLSSGSLKVEISTNNGRDFKPVGTVDAVGDFSLDISSIVFRRYRWDAKLTLSGGAVLETLELSSEVQVSQRALPILTQGKNTITVKAVPGLATLTLTGNVNKSEKRNETWVTMGGATQNIKPGNHLWMEGQYSIPLDQRHGYITFPVECPGDIRIIRFGATIVMKNKKGGIAYQVSFDEGKTWVEVDRIMGPNNGYTHFVELMDVPREQKKVLVRYDCFGLDPCGLKTFRIDADYVDGPRDRVRPFKVIYTWEEDGKPVTHEYTVNKTPVEYTIDIAGKPLMKSVIIKAE